MTESISANRTLRDVRVHEWSRRWLAEQWQEWQPRTRASAAEALGRFSFDQMLDAYDTLGRAAETNALRVAISR
jgi:hypothetical protein